MPDRHDPVRRLAKACCSVCRTIRLKVERFEKATLINNYLSARFGRYRLKHSTKRAGKTVGCLEPGIKTDLGYWSVTMDHIVECAREASAYYVVIRG